MTHIEVERMQAMCRLGLPRAVIVPLMTAFGAAQDMPLEARRFLAGPVVVHESAWNETRSRWIEDEIAAERIGIVFGLTPDLIVGPAEIAAVMYGAMLDNPQSRDHTELYLWAVPRAAASFRGIEIAKVVGGTFEAVTDAMVLLPRGRIHETYRRVAGDIRSRVVRAQEAREREQRRDAREAATPAAPTRRDLFDLLKAGG